MEGEIVHKLELESDKNQSCDTNSTLKPNKISLEEEKGAMWRLSRYFDEDENFNTVNTLSIADVGT